jgi:site-specific recombinase XerD
MLANLAQVLKQWRTPNPPDTDWVFASPYTDGDRPYWPDSALKNHVRPAAKRAKITKDFGWHTLWHSFGTLLGNSGEDLKSVKALLRHANSRITADVYQQGKNSQEAQRRHRDLRHLRGSAR